MNTRKRFSSKEILVLIVAVVLAIVFLPGAVGGAAAASVGAALGTLYGLVPLALLAAAGYSFYRWWETDEHALPMRPSTCPSCSTQIAAGWKACPNCGHDLGGEMLFCRACANPMLRAWKVCPSCSKPVSETVAALPSGDRTVATAA